MRHLSLATLILLLVSSFATGLLLATYDVNPSQLLAAGGDALAVLLERGGAALAGLVRSPRDIVLYTLTGAVVVVPLWLLWLIFRTIRRRSR